MSPDSRADCHHRRKAAFGPYPQNVCSPLWTRQAIPRAGPSPPPPRTGQALLAVDCQNSGSGLGGPVEGALVRGCGTRQSLGGKGTRPCRGRWTRGHRWAGIWAGGGFVRCECLEQGVGAKQQSFGITQVVVVRGLGGPPPPFKRTLHPPSPRCHLCPKDVPNISAYASAAAHVWGACDLLAAPHRRQCRGAFSRTNTTGRKMSPMLHRSSPSARRGDLFGSCMLPPSPSVALQSLRSRYD